MARGEMTRRGIPGDLGILGVGSIAEAIVTGLYEGEDAPPSIHLSPRSALRANRLAARHSSVHVVDSNQTVVDRAEAVLLCVLDTLLRAGSFDVVDRGLDEVAHRLQGE